MGLHVTVLSSEVVVFFLFIFHIKIFEHIFVGKPSSVCTFSNAHALDESQNSAFRLKSFR